MGRHRGPVLARVRQGGREGQVPPRSDPPAVQAAVLDKQPCRAQPRPILVEGRPGGAQGHAPRWVEAMKRTLIAAVLLIALPSSAGYGPTEWGMTLRQVQAKERGGKVSRLSVAKEVNPEDPFLY